MEVTIQFYRPFDRHPGDHIYGEPFDSAMDNLVGGIDRWSSDKSDNDSNPRATVVGLNGTATLHEGGAELLFLIANADKIAAVISALAAAVSAWAAVRANRRKNLPEGDFQGQSGYRLKVDDIEVTVSRELGKAELEDLLKSIVQVRERFE